MSGGYTGSYRPVSGGRHYIPVAAKRDVLRHYRLVLDSSQLRGSRAMQKTVLFYTSWLAHHAGQTGEVHPDLVDRFRAAQHYLDRIDRKNREREAARV